MRCGCGADGPRRHASGHRRAIIPSPTVRVGNHGMTWFSMVVNGMLSFLRGVALDCMSPSETWPKLQRPKLNHRRGVDQPVKSAFIMVSAGAATSRHNGAARCGDGRRRRRSKGTGGKAAARVVAPGNSVLRVGTVSDAYRPGARPPFRRADLRRRRIALPVRSRAQRPDGSTLTVAGSGMGPAHPDTP